MDLFVVERYEGDEQGPSSNISDTKSSHLERLLSKIESKKQQAVKLAKAEEARKQRKEKKKKKVRSTKDAKPALEKQKSVKPQHKERKMKPIKESSSDIDGKFTVLGSDSLGTKKERVKAQLPYWLANPSVVSVDLKNLTVSVDDIPELNRDLVERLKQNGISHFFPVQHQVIPWLLEAQSKPPQFWPRDICVSAPTGSGKTFAFVLPIIQALRNRLIPHIRALVVLPVQELASQVYKVFLEYIGVTNLRVVCITGKESFQQEQSQLVRFSEADGKFHSCVDIVVTTPGRLVDHLQSTTGFSLCHLKYLVIDEADRVMESMQNDWLYHLDRHISSDNNRRVPPLTIRDVSIRHPPPQKLLFSATLSQDPEKLQQLGLFQPRLFTSVVNGTTPEEGSSSEFIGKFTTPAELTELWVACELAVKPLYLYELLNEGNWDTVLVFTNTTEGVHRLSILLKHMFKDKKSVSEVSSALQPKQRKVIFERFASGSLNILVCSDALARGIDVPNIDCVISYDAPKFIKNYIHRVGRTGRAGRHGTAITLVENRQIKKFEMMLTQAGKQNMVKEKDVDISSFEAFEEEYKTALTALKSELEREEEMRKQIRKKPKKYLQFKNKKLQGVTKPSSTLTHQKKFSAKLKHLAKDKKL
ncbi:putative ATP-dependent RNA helicase Dbp73D [Frankliniella fusca]|uniref:ATP-dependent RNA helicase n=1 Tax=Frankliniella fusca TaxID=407009 RepID=A0AAE1H311_9NEOP|nr:putative ATP-dependent RNA helicase Dbp73D [Frankliniella fusca]